MTAGDPAKIGMENSPYWYREVLSAVQKSEEVLWVQMLMLMRMLRRSGQSHAFFCLNAYRKRRLRCHVIVSDQCKVHFVNQFVVLSNNRCNKDDKNAERDGARRLVRRYGS